MLSLKPKYYKFSFKISFLTKFEVSNGYFLGAIMPDVYSMNLRKKAMEALSNGEPEM